MAGPSTLGIQDYMTFADGTERRRSDLEAIAVVNNIPLIEIDEQGKIITPGISPAQKSAAYAAIVNQIISMPQAPTRAGMGKEMAEMEKIRDEMKMLASKLYAIHGKLESRTEMETAQSGLKLSEDSET